MWCRMTSGALSTWGNSSLLNSGMQKITAPIPSGLFYAQKIVRRAPSTVSISSSHAIIPSPATYHPMPTSDITAWIIIFLDVSHVTTSAHMKICDMHKGLDNFTNGLDSFIAMSKMSLLINFGPLYLCPPRVHDQGVKAGAILHIQTLPRLHVMCTA